MKLAAFILLLCGIPLAFGQSDTACTTAFADKQVRFVVGASPGGGWDRSIRALAAQFEQESQARTYVLNITGGNGYLAAKAVIDGTDDQLTIGLMSRELAMNPMGTEELFSLDAFHVLGVLTIDREVWIAHEDFQWDEHQDRSLVAFSVDAYDSALRFGLVGQLLEQSVSTVLGFRSNSEAISALLRGEIDISSTSMASAVRATAGNPIQPLLVLGSEPAAEFPDTPYLAGSGGLVEQLTSGSDTTTRQRRMQMASDIIQLTQPLRAVYASRQVSNETLTCLQAHIDNTLFSPELSEAMARNRQVLTPLDAEAASARLLADQALIEKYRAELTTALEAVSQ
ncbi:MAG: hypothetical protein MI746_09840 [Pseudomonadales bacterium]|nr:hypothetical protein [Pseudomonadales bacterium]